MIKKIRRMTIDKSTEKITKKRRRNAISTTQSLADPPPPKHQNEQTCFALSSADIPFPYCHLMNSHLRIEGGLIIILMSFLDLIDEKKQEVGETLLTEVLFAQNKVLALSSKKYQVYMVEDSIPPTEFPSSQDFTPLPSTVQFSRIVANVITSLSTTYFKQLQRQKDSGNENTIQKWTKYLNLYENKALVSDCFWFAICKFFHAGCYERSEAELEKRIAKSYIGLFLSIPDKKENDVFFKEYFNTLAQSVFYSFFYAFPKSRAKFDNRLKEQLLTTFSKVFTGVEISNKKYYYEKWTLDLGTGNILAKRPKRPQSQTEEPLTSQGQPEPKRGFEKMKKRETLPIRYSPIVELYLKTNKYKTRNYVSQFKMKYTQVDKHEQAKEDRFAYYKEEARRIQEWSDAQKNDDDQKRRQLQAEVKALKRETINHHKRLQRRKAEQLQRGAHEYANYLVSMLNAGITMTSLGVVRKNAP